MGLEQVPHLPGEVAVPSPIPINFSPVPHNPTPHIIPSPDPEGRQIPAQAYPPSLRRDGYSRAAES